MNEQKQKLPKDIEQLLIYQNLTKSPTEEGLRQLVLGICMFVPNCKNCNVEVNSNYVQINLQKFDGLRGWYYKLFKKNVLSEQQIEIINKLVKFWLSFLDNAILNISWK